MSKKFALNSPVTLEFDYTGKDGKVTHRIAKMESSQWKETPEKVAYFKGETISVDGQPPKHPYSTYLVEFMQNVIQVGE